MVANQYGLGIRLWTLWIRSNAPDMWSNSLRGFTQLSKSDQGKIFKLKHMWCQRDSYIFDPTIQPASFVKPTPKKLSSETVPVG